jgi:hypothetical protein
MSKFCSDGDVLFRWSNTFEEAEIDLVFKIKLFHFFSIIKLNFQN